MNRILGFSLFFLVFLIVYGGMHLYVFSRLARIFGIKKNAHYYVALALLALSFPLTSMIERLINGIISKIFYTISAIWVGALFLLLCSMAVYDIIRLIKKHDSQRLGKFLVAITVLIVIYGIINAMFISVREVTIPINNLEEELKIVHISDVHLGTLHTRRYLSDVVDKTNRLNPDIVLITGDLFDGGGKLNEDVITPLNDLKAKAFFTLGNHEQYEGIDDVMAMMSKTNVEVLRDAVAEYKGVQIIGIDNPGERYDDNNNVIGSMEFNKSVPSILMYHPPQGLEDAHAAGVDLQLSGHTHDGQILPFKLLSVLFYPRVNGLYEYKGTYLYVSAGTGTWGPPLRVGSRSEITLIRLVKA